jgi:hypothetical protein
VDISIANEATTQTKQREWRSHNDRCESLGSLKQRRRKMKDKQVIYKIREWLIINIRQSMCMGEELLEDNKLLLKAIRDWRQDELPFQAH